MNVEILTELIKDATGCGWDTARYLAEAIFTVARDVAVDAIDDLATEKEHA